MPHHVPYVSHVLLQVMQRWTLHHQLCQVTKNLLPQFSIEMTQIPSDDARKGMWQLGESAYVEWIWHCKNCSLSCEKCFPRRYILLRMVLSRCTLNRLPWNLPRFWNLLRVSTAKLLEKLRSVCSRVQSERELNRFGEMLRHSERA